MTTEVKTEIQEQPKEKKAPDQSFAELRKSLEAERMRSEQMQQKMVELEKQLKSTKAPVKDDEDDFDEPYIDPKTFKKQMAKFEESIEQKIEKKAEEKARSLIEEQQRYAYLKQNSDFEQTMAPDMIQKFAEKHPAMAEAILRMPDTFERQKLVYEAIKSTGVNKKEEPSIQKTIDANRRNPFYQPTGIGTAPYGMQGDFSESGQKNAYNKLKELKSRLRLG